MLEEKEKSWKIVKNEHTVRVSYRDTDQMGVVYYANYLVWFEFGRTELLRQTGFTYREFEKKGYVLPVVHCTCDYKKPAHYDDIVKILTQISSLNKVSVIFHYRIIRENTGELLAVGETKHVFLNKKGHVARAGHLLEAMFE